MTWTEARFTRIVLRDLLHWPGMAEDLPSWRCTSATREEAEVELAAHLHRMVLRDYRKRVYDRHVWRLVRVGLMYVSWRHIAARLFDEHCHELTAMSAN
jgi:hypothetical protein